MEGVINTTVVTIIPARDGGDDAAELVTDTAKLFPPLCRQLVVRVNTNISNVGLVGVNFRPLWKNKVVNVLPGNIIDFMHTRTECVS